MYPMFKCSLLQRGEKETNTYKMGDKTKSPLPDFLLWVVHMTVLLFLGKRLLISRRQGGGAAKSESSRQQNKDSRINR